MLESFFTVFGTIIKNIVRTRYKKQKKNIATLYNNVYDIKLFRLSL